MMEVEVDMPVLEPFQEEWVRDGSRFRVIEGATGTGKTYVFEPELFAEAHKEDANGYEFWWCSPTIAQARAVYENVKRSIEDAGLSTLYRCSDTLREIHTPRGGVLCYRTAEHPDHLFGIRNVKHIIVDEFTRCRIALWPALLSVANKTGARITFIGNYQGDDTEWHAWAKKMATTPKFRYWKTPAGEAVKAGIMAQEDFNMARETLPDPIFKALYLCEGSSDPNLLVQRGAVADLWTNSHVIEGPPALTCDIALHGSDRFVVMAWRGMVMVEVCVWTKRSATEVEDIIRQKAKEHGAGLSQISYDADGLGTYLRGYLKGAIPYTGGSAPVPEKGKKMSYQRLRDQCHFLAADTINARGMWLKDDAHREELEPEIFACLRSAGQTPAGAWRIAPKDEAKRLLGRSPDLFDPIPIHVKSTINGASTMASSFKRRGISIRRGYYEEGLKRHFNR